MYKEIEVTTTLEELKATYTIKEHSIGLFGIHCYVMVSGNKTIKLMVNPYSSEILKAWIK